MRLFPVVGAVFPAICRFWHGGDMAEWNGEVHPFFYGGNAGAYAEFVIGGGGAT